MGFLKRLLGGPASPSGGVADEDAGWSVIDLETTGLYPKTDRIVEIGVVRLSQDGREVGCWTSLVDPCRHVGAAEIHGLTAFDLRGAPTFADIAPSLLSMLAGSRLAAHNARFDMTFLSRELERAGLGWGEPDALCTMNMVSSLGLASRRGLAAACEELGIEHEAAHCAISDARATAALLVLGLAGIDRLPAVLPRLSNAPVPPPSRTRSEPPPPRVDTSLGALADRVGVPDGLDVSRDEAVAYLALLDRVLEDRRITDQEVRALADMAADWGVSPTSAGALHSAYLGGVWELAKADGVITDAEARDLKIIAELLGVPLDQAAPARPVGRDEDLRGKAVCFTGESVVSIRGAVPSREAQEAMASLHGLVVKSGVSRKCDILVLADTDSRSGKAAKADELGVRKIAEPVFWRLLGVEID